MKHLTASFHCANLISSSRFFSDILENFNSATNVNGNFIICDLVEVSCRIPVRRIATSSAASFTITQQEASYSQKRATFLFIINTVKKYVTCKWQDEFGNNFMAGTTAGNLSEDV